MRSHTSCFHSNIVLSCMYYSTWRAFFISMLPVSISQNDFVICHSGVQRFGVHLQTVFYFRRWTFPSWVHHLPKCSEQVSFSADDRKLKELIIVGKLDISYGFSFSRDLGKLIAYFFNLKFLKFGRYFCVCIAGQEFSLIILLEVYYVELRVLAFHENLGIGLWMWFGLSEPGTGNSVAAVHGVTLSFAILHVIHPFSMHCLSISKLLLPSSLLYHLLHFFVYLITSAYDL